MSHIHRIEPQGWIVVPIPFRFVSIAKKWRRQRDIVYKNIYRGKETDERWVGDLGEIVFKSWLNYANFFDYVWLLEEAAGKPDFVLSSNLKVGVKSVKRAGGVRDDYTAQVTAGHARRPVEDHYFFMNYDFVSSEMWLLGGISHGDFMVGAKYYGPGEVVHEHYTVPPDHEIFNIEINKLTRPLDWMHKYHPNMPINAF